MCRIFWLTLFVAMLAGCSGLPTASELRAQKQVAAVSAAYAPSEKKGRLPRLRQESPLSDFLLYGILNSSEVEAAFYRWAAAVQLISVERSLQDPNVSFQADITKVVMSLMPGAMFDFPGPGKLRARAEVQSAESQARYYEFETAVYNTVLKIKRAYYQLYFLEEKIKVNEHILALLKDLEELARRRNELGLTSLDDVLRIQIEQERLKTEIVNLEESRKPLLMQFKGALGLKPDSAPPPVPSHFQTTAINLSEGALLKTALKRNPSIKKLEAQIDRAKAQLLLAKKDKVPDLSVGLEVDLRSTPYMWRPRLGLTLPIWRDKIAAKIAAAELQQQEAERQLSQEEIELAVEIAERLYAYREATALRSTLSEQIIPRAQQALDISRTDYSAGKTPFLSLIENTKLLYSVQLELVEANARRELALADLEFLVTSFSAPGSPLLSQRESQPTVVKSHKR